MDTVPIQNSVTLPGNLPAKCFIESANDYQIPEMVLVALIKVESNGKSTVGRNNNGTFDIGVAQHNSKTWVPYMQNKYGVTPESLLNNPCQSIRAAAYVLRSEMNHKSCKGDDIWCAIKRYHSPNNQVEGNKYLSKIQNAIKGIYNKGAF